MTTVLTVAAAATATLAGRRLPAAIFGTAAPLAVAASTTGSWPRPASAAAGSTGLGTLYLVLHLAAPGQLGLGDVELSPLIGRSAGWFGLTAVITTAMTIAVLITAICLIAPRSVWIRGAFAAGPVILPGAPPALLLQPAASA